ncbi:hypothetical protein WMY93_012081 [Mugilogobius chulae]|uniref:von Willebrand factor A domain-containing protein 1 n=1 Tax=Mugilogobius chulae TaxID=88201 RepID=A0AAW0P5P7_9GOBI
MSPTDCLMSTVSYRLSHVSYRLSHVSYRLSHVSCLLQTCSLTLSCLLCPSDSCSLTLSCLLCPSDSCSLTLSCLLSPTDCPLMSPVSLRLLLSDSLMSPYSCSLTVSLFPSDSCSLTLSCLLCPSDSCFLTEDHRADVVLLLDGFTHIGPDDFSKVTDFLEALVRTLGVVGLESVRVGLVKCGGGELETEFYLNTHHNVSSVVSAVKTLTQSPPSPGNLTYDHMEFVRTTFFQTGGGDRIGVPDVLILISDRKTGVSKEIVHRLWRFEIKVFVVGVEEADYSQIKDIGHGLAKPDVFTVKDVGSFSNILNELTQSFCQRIKQKLGLAAPESVRFPDVQPRRARVSWSYSGGSVESFTVLINPDLRQVNVLGHERTVEIRHLKPNSSYELKISAFRAERSPPLIGRLTTQQDSLRLIGGPSRCSGSPQVLVDHTWSSVCAQGFGHTEAEVLCRELDCGGVSELQREPLTEGSAVGTSFHCSGAETALKDCGSSEVLCSAAVNVTCSDDVLLWISGLHCNGLLELRHEDQWRKVKTVDRDVDLDFGSALCQRLGCGWAVEVFFRASSGLSWWTLDSECVKQRTGLRDCLVHDNNTQDMNSLFLICSVPNSDLILRAAIYLVLILIICTAALGFYCQVKN